MPELPEVETTRRGIAPHILGYTIDSVILRQQQLRWPVPEYLAKRLQGQKFHAVNRRGKYLLLQTKTGTLLIHLGMSGSLRILPVPVPAAKHDHADLIFASGVTLRFTDPRRFGCLLWIEGDATSHGLLSGLGPEPLSDSFDGDYLKHRSGGRRQAVKSFIMDGRVVVGVGNIYASEALFRAGIRPGKAAGRISRFGYGLLADAIRDVLSHAIQVGGTTLRDFTGSDGQPGYFSQSLNVYGRNGLPCRRCGSTIKLSRLGQRSSFYCPSCQR